jgi:hypothetical protein
MVKMSGQLGQRVPGKGDLQNWDATITHHAVAELEAVFAQSDGPENKYSVRPSIKDVLLYEQCQTSDSRNIPENADFEVHSFRPVMWISTMEKWLDRNRAQNVEDRPHHGMFQRYLRAWSRLESHKARVLMEH